MPRRRHGKVGRSWYVDEVYIKVSDRWCYLYRAIGRHRQAELGCMIGQLGRQRVLALLKAHYGHDEFTRYWNSGDFLHSFGNVPSALVHAALFVPEFIEVEGCVFLKDLGIQFSGGWETAAQRIRQARAASPEVLDAFLATCNWVEVPYLFGNHRAESDEDCDALAALIVEAWRARLADQFPDRRFVIRTISPEETGSVVGVGFVEA